MKRRFDLYLKDILESIRRIKEYSEDEEKSEMIKVDAILRNLEIIGEAATQIPKEVKSKHKDIPWRDIQDFRIIVAHHYWKINLERVWDIVQNKLPVLEKQVKDLLKKEKLI